MGKTGVDEAGQVTWGPCEDWKETCRTRAQDLNQIFGKTYRKDTHDLSETQKEYTFNERTNLGLTIKDVDNKVYASEVQNQGCVREGIVDGSQLLSVNDITFTNHTEVKNYLETAKLPIKISFMCPTGRDGWMYLERSFTTAANDRLAKFENGSEEPTDDEIKTSTKTLETLGIYKNSLDFEPILKVLNGTKGIRSRLTGTYNGRPVLTTREDIIKLLTTQLGNTKKVREKDRIHLARLLENEAQHIPPCLDCKGYGEVCSESEKCRTECHLKHLLSLGKCTSYLIPCDTCSETCQLYQPLFYTYDDKPCFNLVSGIMQAREDMSLRNSLRGLQEDVKELRVEVQKLKNLNPITPTAPPKIDVYPDVPYTPPSHKSSKVLPQRSGPGYPVGETCLAA